MEFAVLGPLEIAEAGVPVPVQGSKQRALLALLLLHANHVVPSDRIVDELWGDEPPQSGLTALQVRVSQLRKALGARGARLETRAPGYLLRVERDELDLHRFGRLTQEAARAEATNAAALLREALALWRGTPLAEFTYDSFAQAAIGRLEELRLAALGRRVAAELTLGLHAELVPELEGLVSQHPLREQLQGQLMLALYRSGRQADALAAFQRVRQALVDELGIEPGPALRELERQILRQDAGLDPPQVAATLPTLLLVDATESLLEIGEALAREPAKELVLARLLDTAERLRDEAAELEGRRAAIADRGVAARAAAFVARDRAADIVRMAVEQDADLVALGASREPLAEPVARELLDRATCDVAVYVDGSPAGDRVLVPFVGTEHDWAAVELGAWLARSVGAPLVLAGPMEGQSGRDSSRLLASASLAVQRALGVSAAPLLLEATPAALVEAANGSRAVVAGLGDRWRHEGLGTVRQTLAAEALVPVLFVRKGLRPGGLAPREAFTRFTWSWRG